MISVAVIFLQSILVGVLGDFHFQALRIYTQEKKLLHGYYMYEVTVQPAGGMCGLDFHAGLGVSALPVVSLMVARNCIFFFFFFLLSPVRMSICSST